jgi:hypothetical protein
MTATTNHSMTFHGASLAELFANISNAGTLFKGGAVLGPAAATTPVDPKALSTNDAVRIAKTDALVVPPTAAAKKKAAAAAAAQAEADAAEAASAEADVLGGEGEADEETAYTIKDVRDALGEMRDAHGKNKPNLLTEFISQFGVTMASQLKPEQFAKVIGAANNYQPAK